MSALPPIAVKKPEAMLFDEVTGVLDPETVKEVLVTIREFAEDGMTCIIVTHEMAFAREVDQIYFTDRGVVIEHAPSVDLFTQCRNERTRQFLSQIACRRVHAAAAKRRW